MREATGLAAASCGRRTRPLPPAACVCIERVSRPGQSPPAYRPCGIAAFLPSRLLDSTSFLSLTDNAVILPLVRLPARPLRPIYHISTGTMIVHLPQVSAQRLLQMHMQPSRQLQSEIAIETRDTSPNGSGPSHADHASLQFAIHSEQQTLSHSRPALFSMLRLLNQPGPLLPLLKRLLDRASERA